MSGLFIPPRWFTEVKFHRHTDRSIGWLELFYDLVYVAMLIQIGNFLSDNLTGVGFAQFLVLITVVWWSWTGETFYQNRYVADDLTHRLLVFLQIFAIASLGISVSQAFGDLYIQFTLAYVLNRFVLVLMYLRAARFHPQSAAISRGFAGGYSIGIVIWLGSLLLPPAYHWVGWLVGIAVELAVPLTPNMRQHTRKWGTDIHHISERFGIFTIIVLGESFVKVLDDAQGATIGVPEMLFSTFGLTVLYALWWLYFTDTAGKLIDFTKRLKPIVWVYGHLPLAVGLVAFGVGAKKLFSATIDHPAEVLEPSYRLLYSGAVIFYLVALGLIDSGLEESPGGHTQRHKTIRHLASAAIVAAISLLAVNLNPIAFVSLIALVMLGNVIYTMFGRDEQRQEDHPAEATEMST